MTWLSSLGEIKVDWGQLIMKVVHGGREVEVKGDPSLTRRVVTPEALIKEKGIEMMSLVWSLSQTELVDEKTEESGLMQEEEVELEQILSAFEGVFRDPKASHPRGEWITESL
ncbi:hypothetical protein LR48_Vigan07g085000 [Vigna angularis]|uniref:Uncharacterized protein n=1 Tax=Phaseolus angularis TaxID=3914 RepID=A0A0L9UWN5_PHAAN|nr:hypothetical protein LR48_Vigan07g085000 [Vigna angularis]